MKNVMEHCLENQLRAYNEQQVEACVACFSADAVIERETDGSRTAGHAALREFYSELFRKFPKNHCTILHRIVVDSYVVDEELIEGRDGGPFRTVIVNFVENGLIKHMRVLAREAVR